jgi:hypothetical protein
MIRYRLHRVLPMRALHRVESWLVQRYARTRSDWSCRWLDRLSWFTTPYRGARKDSGMVRSMSEVREMYYYRLIRHGTTNVRWEMLRAYGDPRYRALGLTGGTHGRGDN